MNNKNVFGFEYQEAEKEIPDGPEYSGWKHNLDLFGGNWMLKLSNFKCIFIGFAWILMTSMAL